MSKQKLKPVTVPHAEFERMLRMMMRPDPLSAAIEKATGWPAKCPGPCFPSVYRSWMSHPAFLDA